MRKQIDLKHNNELVLVKQTLRGDSLLGMALATSIRKHKTLFPSGLNTVGTGMVLHVC